MEKLTTMSPMFEWKKKRTLKEQVADFYSRFNDPRAFGVSEGEIRKIVKRIQSQINEPNFDYEYIKSWGARSFLGSRTEEAYINHSCIELAVVESELAKETPDFDLGWSHLLEAFLCIQRLDDVKSIKKGKSPVKSNKKLKEFNEKTRYLSLKEKLIELITGDLKPTDGWLSRKQLADTAREHLNDKCNEDELNFTNDDWERRIRDWIREYRPINDAYKLNKRPKQDKIHRNINR